MQYGTLADPAPVVDGHPRIEDAACADRHVIANGAPGAPGPPGARQARQALSNLPKVTIPRQSRGLSVAGPSKGPIRDG